MVGNKKNVYYILLLLPVVCALSLWGIYAFPESEEISKMAYYAQMLAIVLTIVGVPLLLKYVTPQRCGDNYSKICVLRMAYQCVVTMLELLFYYCLCVTPTFFYLAIITWLSMFFAFPKAEAVDTDNSTVTEES